MSYYYFDIETAPLPESDLIKLSPEFKPPGNYSNPDKIAAVLAEKKASWTERAALSAVTGRVVAIGVRNQGHNAILVTGDEKQDLQKWWDCVLGCQTNSHILVGFNISGFDVPYLIRRSWALGVKVPHRIYNGRYLNNNLFIDLMDVWCMGNKEDRISLKNLSVFLGCGDKEVKNSKNFGALLLSNRAEAIAHLENDLLLTERVAGLLLPPVESPKRGAELTPEY